MRCDDPRCTGNHNDRKWETLCPRTVESKLASGRQRYARSTWVQRHAKQLKTRRYQALTRHERRATSHATERKTKLT